MRDDKSNSAEDEKLFLNLGCGSLPIKGCLNIDCIKGEHVDQRIDLSIIPWPFKENSVDGIYMIHSLEHFSDAAKILNECDRILKKGAFLHIQGPHSSSSCCGIGGDITHYRTFSYGALGRFLKTYKVMHERIIWWIPPRRKNNRFVPYYLNKSPNVYYIIIYPLALLIQFLIDLSPKIFERFWANYVGGADEIIWRGYKENC